MRHKKKFKQVITYLIMTVIILVTLTGCSIFDNPRGAVVACFNVEPGLTVEVNEEVYFDATCGRYQPSPETDYTRYEWDFGDGYYLQFGKPTPLHMDAGIACTHFFTTPGTFTVTLTVTAVSGEKDKTTKEIIVTGNPRTGKLDLMHANFHGHIDQYIYAKLAEGVNESCQLEMSIEGDTGYYQRMYYGSLSPGDEKRFLLENAQLPLGNYVLTARLYNINGILIDEAREKFSKPYNGIPHIGINKNNAFCVDGIPFYPVTGFLLNPAWLNEWGGRYVNSNLGVGYYDNQTITTWTDYCYRAYYNNVWSMGPIMWDGVGNQRVTNRNNDVNKIKDYVVSARNNPGLFMWCWDDETNMGGRPNYIPPPVVRSWTYLGHKLDPHHLSAGTLYGYDFLPYYDDRQSLTTKVYAYITNAGAFGGRRTFPYDCFTFDVYPLEYAGHTSLGGDDNTRLFEYYTAAMDTLIERNYNLIPVMSAIEVQDIQNQNNPTVMPGPTPEQLRMEIWLNVVHEMKGVSWFHYFGPTPDENKAIMEEFTQQVKEWGVIILSGEPDFRVMDNANTLNNRVDFLVRESPDYIWIFAVRVTEIENEPAVLNNVVFTVRGAGSGEVTVIDLLSKITRTIQISGDIFEDDFEECDVHVYKIPK